DMTGCKLRLEQEKIAVHDLATKSIKNAPPTDEYLQVLTKAKEKASELVAFTLTEHQKLKDQAEANAKACDRANETIKFLIEDTARRATIIVYDEDLKKIDDGRKVCNEMLDRASSMSGDVLSQCADGIKLLIGLVTELAKEAAILYKKRGVTGEAAL